MKKTAPKKPRRPGRKEVSQSEFARMEHISRQGVQHRIAAGMPTRNGKVPVAEARRWSKANLSVPAGSSESFAAARARKESALANLRELEFRTKDSKYVLADDVTRELYRQYDIDRSILLDWTSRFVTELARDLGIDDFTLEQTIGKHVRDLLLQLSDQGTFGTPKAQFQNAIEKMKESEAAELSDEPPPAKG